MNTERISLSLARVAITSQALDAAWAKDARLRFLRLYPLQDTPGAVLFTCNGKVVRYVRDRAAEGVTEPAKLAKVA